MIDELDIESMIKTKTYAEDFKGPSEDFAVRIIAACNDLEQVKVHNAYMPFMQVIRMIFAEIGIKHVIVFLILVMMIGVVLAFL